MTHHTYANLRSAASPQAGEPEAESGDAALDAALDFVADLDSIDQRRQMLDRERAAVIEAAQARFSAVERLDDDSATSLFSHLYWALLGVPPVTLAGLFGRGYRTRSNDLTPLPIGTGIHCVGCNAELMAQSRFERTKIINDIRRAARQGRDPTTTCPTCRESQSSAAGRKWEAQRKAEQVRQRELRLMPYSRYLKTDEWMETRRVALKRARYACQICKRTNAILDVHHNTYERRGCEWASDLLVMCRDCHGTHHGKLPASEEARS